MVGEITVSVGEKAKFKTGTFSSINFVYCGMPNDSVFSISYMESTGYQGYAMNIFYPKRMKNIRPGSRQLTGWNQRWLRRKERKPDLTPG